MTVRREPLTRWRSPASAVLTNEFYPSGRPPFAPFPTVTNLMNANLCPVALYHDFIHGIENALMEQYPLQRRGELFHRFIAYLKLSLRNGDFQLRGDLRSQRQIIINLFRQFSRAQAFTLNESNDIWRLYVEPWVTRKLQNQDLQNISDADQFFFEISVANPRIRFPLNDGIRNYPLRGRIDEVDLTRRRIIERTIKGDSTDSNVPLLKDYQVWLLWKILCSLDSGQLPPAWNNVNFQDFELIVETPHRDFPISDNPEYISHTHWAYAWINDISVSESPGVFREVFENAQCSPENVHPHCRHPFINCFPRLYQFPRSRPEIRLTFQPWYRLLLWEQMWKGHLWHYQLLTLNREELVNLGLVIETQIVSPQGYQLELEIIGREVSTLRGYDYCTVIPYGTLHCGLKLNARLIRMEGNRIFLQLETRSPSFSRGALLLLSPEAPSPIMREPPIFLDRQMQSALFRLKRIGSENEQRARRRSLIQLLEAIFGIRRLRRGRR